MSLFQIKQNQSLHFDNAEAWATDAFLSLGVLGFAMFLLLGITSLPSVSSTLNWREFRFIQSKLGYLTLTVCTAHCLLYGWNKFLKPSTYKWFTPPGFMLCLVVPCVVLVLKVILSVPCIDHRLTLIRNGWERSTKTQRGKTDISLEKGTTL